MSCWKQGLATLQAGHHATGSPHAGGGVVAHPNKCATCGCYVTRAGTCVNPGCGAMEHALTQAGADPQPSQRSSGDWAQLPAVTVDGSLVRLTSDVAAYLRTVGLSRPVVEAALARTKVQVWQHLPRCCHCQAFVRRETAVCNNLRCAKGRTRAQVASPGEPWIWPPQAVNAVYLGLALRGVGGAPDSHAAWHQRVYETLTDPDFPVPLQGRATQVKQTCRERYATLQTLVEASEAGGWLDATHPAFDAEAYTLISDAVARIESTANLGPADAALRGDWALLSLPLGKSTEMLNPLSMERVEIAAEADRVWRGVSKSTPRTRSNVAARMARGMQDALLLGAIPALPPEPTDELRPLLDDLRTYLVSDLSWLKAPHTINRGFGPVYGNGGSPVATFAPEAYWWLALARCQYPDPLTSGQTDAARFALTRAAEALGYGPLDDEEAKAVLDNAWSPAQWRHAKRAADRAKVAVLHALRNDMSDPGEAYQAGRVLGAQVAELRRQHLLRETWTQGTLQHAIRVWTGELALPQMTEVSLRAFTAGAGAGVVAHMPVEGLLRWRDLVVKGHVFDAVPVVGMVELRAVASIEAEMQAQGILHSEWVVDEAKLDAVRAYAPKSGASMWYRVRVSVDSSGSLVSVFEVI